MILLAGDMQNSRRGEDGKLENAKDLPSSFVLDNCDVSTEPF
jgi:hypothetical protein